MLGVGVLGILGFKGGGQGGGDRGKGVKGSGSRVVGPKKWWSLEGWGLGVVGSYTWIV